MTRQTLEIPVSGMDCTEYTMHMQHVDGFLASEKALVRCDPQQVDLKLISQAVADTGILANSSRSIRQK